MIDIRFAISLGSITRFATFVALRISTRSGEPIKIIWDHGKRRFSICYLDGERRAAVFVRQLDSGIGATCLYSGSPLGFAYVLLDRFNID